MVGGLWGGLFVVFFVGCFWGGRGGGIYILSRLFMTWYVFEAYFRALAAWNARSYG